MIRDRMPDLLKLAQSDPTLYNEPEAHKDAPLDRELAVMFDRVAKVVKFLSLMKELMRELRKAHDKLLLSASYDQEQECRQVIEKLGNRFGALARKSKSVLKRIETDEDTMRNYAAGDVGQVNRGYTSIEMTPVRKPAEHITWHRMPSGALLPLSNEHYIPAEIRMRFHLHSIFSYDLTCLVREYYIMQKVYGDQCREKIKRQMSIIGKEIEDAELDEAIHRRERLPLLHQEITDDVVIDSEMRAKLREVEVFHQEILQLEQNIAELHKSFVTVSTLVYEHGEIIDSIELHVSTSADYVEDSTELLKKASGFQHKYRKKRCVLAILIVVIIAIVIIIIVVSVHKSHKTTKKTEVVYVHESPSKKRGDSSMQYGVYSDVVYGTDFGVY